MAVFSTNQNRQLYVAKAYNASVSDASAVGTIGGVKVIGTSANDKELVFFYKGADNTLKSDRIQLKNLDYAKAVAAADMIVPLKKVEVTLDSAVNGGAPVVGQDYVLGINLRQWIGMSDEDTYYKDGAVHVTAGMTASDFYKAMVKSLNLSFSREIGATKDSNPYLDFAVDNNSTATKIIITEKIQGWTLGTEAQERVLFDVNPTYIYTGGDDVIWGKVEDKTPAKYVEDTDSSSPTYEQMIPNPALVAGTNAIGNGCNIADLEYFCMGERGDQYRNVGWPNVITTKYLVDPTDEYNTLEIHFAFTDTGVNSYRSEKDITIVADDKSVLNSFIGAINSAAGTEIATL